MRAFSAAPRVYVKRGSGKANGRGSACKAVVILHLLAKSVYFDMREWYLFRQWRFPALSLPLLSLPTLGRLPPNCC